MWWGKFLTAFMSRFRSNLTFACHMLTASQCDLLCRIWRSCHIYQMRFLRTHIVDSSNRSKHNVREVICVGVAVAGGFIWLPVILSSANFLKIFAKKKKNKLDEMPLALPPFDEQFQHSTTFIDGMNWLEYNNYQNGKMYAEIMDWKHASTKCNDLSLKGASE